MAKTVIGLFDDFSQAQQVVQALVNGGFRREEVSLVRSDPNGEFSGSVSTGEGNGGHGGGALAGAGTGAALGGLAGLLVGLGALAIPGVGPIIAAGPIAAALGGAGIGAVAGGLIGTLTDLGVPETEARYYDEGVRRGGTLVAVKADDDEVNNAVNIMNRFGAVDIQQRAATWSDQPTETGATSTTMSTTPAGSATTTSTHVDMPHTTSAASTMGTTVGTVSETRDTATATNMTTNQGEIRVPIVEEQLQVGKRQVQEGGAHIHTEIVEQPVQANVTLREENVVVERRAVDRPLTEGDVAAFRQGDIEITETKEVPVVAKEARVVEEIVVRKDVEERTVPIQDTVRRTEVTVDETPSTHTSTTQTSTTSQTTGQAHTHQDGSTHNHPGGQQQHRHDQNQNR